MSTRIMDGRYADLWRKIFKELATNGAVDVADPIWDDELAQAADALEALTAERDALLALIREHQNECGAWDVWKLLPEEDA